MRQAIISDIHTVDNFEYILSFLENGFLDKALIDEIVVNGDLLGLFSIKCKYGGTHNHGEFIQSLDKKKILEKAAPCAFKELSIYSVLKVDTNDKEALMAFKQAVLNYAKERYNWVIDCLKRLSKLKKTYFNFGNHESPYYKLVLNELEMFLNIDGGLLHGVVSDDEFNGIFTDFINSLNELEKTHNFVNFSGKVLVEDDRLMVGIPGLSHSSRAVDKFTTKQENLTKGLIKKIKQKIDQVNKVIIYNHTEHPTSQDGSNVVRELFKDLKHKNQLKVFVNSHNHLATSRFYMLEGFYNLQNIVGVLNSLFNVIKIEDGVEVFDIDPNLSKIRKLKLADSELFFNLRSMDRLKLNYDDAEFLVKERNLEKWFG